MTIENDVLELEEIVTEFISVNETLANDGQLFFKTVSVSSTVSKY